MNEGLLLDLGHRPYGEVLELQRRLAHLRAAGEIPDTLILVEHPPTLTFGRSTSSAHLLASALTLEQLQVDVFEVERGGEATYHGPGQLVGYPILDLTRRGRDVHAYLRRLEEVLIRVLADWGVTAGRLPGRTGVWVSEEKIASIGIHVSRWITRHGFALNVSPDLSFFDLIVPCGLPGVRMTSLAATLQAPPSWTDVVSSVTREFSVLFDIALGPMPVGSNLDKLSLQSDLSSPVGGSSVFL